MATEERRRSRTILWCVPRTISTAITKCLSAIKDNQIWFESYFFCRMFAGVWKQSLNTELAPDYKGNEVAYHQVLDSLAESTSIHYKPEYISFASLKRHLEKSSSPHVFLKDMAINIHEYDPRYLPDGYKHTFLIRHPLRSFFSFRKSVYKFLLNLGALKGSAADGKIFDLERDNPYYSRFYEDQYAVWKYVRENIDSHPIVIDSDEFLANPAEMLPKYCRAIGLPYAESLLKWDASADVVKSWETSADDLFEQAGHFYDTATRSGEFLPSSEMPSRDHMTPDIIRCTDRVMKYYEEMFESRIRLDSDAVTTSS